MHCAFYKDGQVSPVFETNIPQLPTLSKYAILPLLEDALIAWKQVKADVSDIDWDLFALSGMTPKTRSHLDRLKDSYHRYKLSDGLTSGSFDSSVVSVHASRLYTVQL